MARILIIDDDAAVRDAMAFLLRMHGYDTIVAGEGAKGIAMLDAGPVDLAIVDRYMPKMDGFEVIKSIRAKQPKLPIIAMSGSLIDEALAMLPHLPSGADFGAIRSVPKPLKAEVLISTIEELLAANGRAH